MPEANMEARQGKERARKTSPASNRNGETMTTKCTGIMGSIFGHKFRPVITLSASTFNSAGVQCKAHAALEMADKYRDEIFHGCICQRCGAVKGEEK